MSSSSELVATTRPRGRVLRLGATSPVGAPLAALAPTLPPAGALTTGAPAAASPTGASTAAATPTATPTAVRTATDPRHPFDIDLMALAGGAEPVLDEAALLAASQEAYEAGYRQGVAEALEQARAERDAQLAAEAERVRAITDAVARAAGRAADAVASAEAAALRTLAEATLALARAVIGRELALTAHPGLDAVVRALGAIPDAGAVLVRMHPADLADEQAVRALLPGRDVDVVADDSVEHGGCVIEAGEARIDATVSAALERARAVLLDDDTFSADPGTDPESGAISEAALRFTAGPADEDGTLR